MSNEEFILAEQVVRLGRFDMAFLEAMVDFFQVDDLLGRKRDGLLRHLLLQCQPAFVAHRGQRH